MKKIYILFLNLLLFNLFNQAELVAQDMRFSQSYSNPLRINPAIMGVNTDIKAILNYRSQFAAIDNGYKTFSFTGMYPLFFNEGKSKLDIGASIINDKMGAFKVFDAALAIDYNQEIAPNNILTLALMGGFVQQSVDISKQTFDYQYVMGAYNASNPSNEFGLNKSENHPELGFGLMWFYNPSREKSKLNAYAGIAGYHLNKPNESFLGEDAATPLRFAYQGGIKILGDNKIDVSPNFRMNSQGGNLETATGVYVDYRFNEQAKLVIGAWYRTHDAIAFLVGFEHKNFTLGYSYDMVNSNLKNVAVQANAHEITLSFKLSRASKSKSASFGMDEAGNPRSSPISSF
ncbi:MAG: PorP/SprF family type IX secretion system membrane protein [Bacteroidia bacterium]